jgi:hypothetical protein
VVPQVSLRHTLATLAYRLDRAISEAPAEFATTNAGGDTRSAVEILAHIGDLMDWALSIVRGQETWNDAAPLAWPEEVARVEKAISALDEAIASCEELKMPAATLFQGPIADALWHTGQLAMLRRTAGSPIKPKNYTKAPITEGALSIS